MQQSPKEPLPKLALQDGKPSDGKIVRLTPRHRPATEQMPNPPIHDDNDPGPSAA